MEGLASIEGLASVRIKEDTQKQGRERQGEKEYEEIVKFSPLFFHTYTLIYICVCVYMND